MKYGLVRFTVLTVVLLTTPAVWGATPDSVTMPACDQLQFRQSENQITVFHKDQPKTGLAAVYTVPAKKADKIVFRVEKDHLYFDTREQNKNGYDNIQMNWFGLDFKAMAEKEYCLTTEVKGPKGGKGNFYFEGRTVENKHYYQRLPIQFNGNRQKFAFEQVIPNNLAELHLRYDFFTPGEYRFYSFTLVQEKTIPPTENDFKPELTFHASFDGNANATKARGDQTPKRAKNLEWVPGLQGQAVRFSRANKALLEYHLKGNIDSRSGAISVWVKPDVVANPNEQKSIDNLWRTILSMPWEGQTRIGSGAIWFWIYEGRLRADTSDLLDKYMMAPLNSSHSWHHLVFCWNPWYTRLYIDGRDYGGSSDNLNRAQPHHPRRYSYTDFASFFIGNYQNRPFEGAIDELRIYSAPILSSEVQRLFREFQSISLKPGNRYFMSDMPLSLTGSIGNQSKTDTVARLELKDEHGNQVASRQSLNLPAQKSTDYELIWKEPRPGNYLVSLFIKDELKETYSVQVFDAKKFSPVKPPLSNRPDQLWDSKLSLKLVETIDPATIAPDRMAIVGTLEKVTHKGRTYVHTPGKSGNRFAIRLPKLSTERQYCFEWDIPDNMKRTVDIIAQSALANTSNEYELQTGYSTGDEYSCSQDFITQRCLYWPRNEDVALIFMTARNGEGGAALAQLRIYEVTSPLPNAIVRAAKPVAGWSRPIGIYFEDPAIHYDFGVDGAFSAHFEEFISRLTNYMRYSGQNLLAYPVVWYNGMIGSKYMPRGHVPQFLDAYLTVFDREGLEFMATINQNNADIDTPIVTFDGIRNGHYNNSAFTIHNTGTPHPGGWHGTPPIYNMFHPAIRQMTLDYFDEILATGVKHPSFKGIILHLPRHALHSLGDIRAGYNDYMIEEFEKDTKIKIPVDHTHPKRGKLYYEWLMANAKEQWIDWRCQKVALWYKELAAKVRAARPDLKLGINCMTPILYESSTHQGKDFWNEINREAGIDAKYFANDPTLFIEQTLFPADYRWMADRSSYTARDGLRNTEERAAMYESLASSKTPWIHMHDRYWESPIGDPNVNHVQSNQFHAQWLREHYWRVSTINPVGFHAIKHYVMPLRYHDILGFSKGGFLIGTYGMEDELIRFAQAYRALPAVPFEDVSGSTETVKVRRCFEEGKTWFYIVNTNEKEVQVQLKLNANQVVDLARNLALPIQNGILNLTLPHYRLQSFSVMGNVEFAVTVK